jgi:hypothetical protein
LNLKSKTHKAHYNTKSQRKAQEGHLEKGKTPKPTNGMKSGKTKKKQRKPQTQHSP